MRLVARLVGLGTISWISGTDPDEKWWVSSGRGNSRGYGWGLLSCWGNVGLMTEDIYSGEEYGARNLAVHCLYGDPEWDPDGK